MSEPTPAELNESAMNQFSRGNGLEAARQLQWALIGDPCYSEAWHNRAMVLRALNDPFDAIMCCEKALALDPTCAAYYNTLGVCWASLSQFQKAVESYEHALELDARLAPAWHNIGYAANLSGHHDAAVKYHQRSSELDPSNADYHLALAAAYLRAGYLAAGFDEYQWRFKSSDAFHRNMPLPECNLALSIGGCRGVVIYAEQGFGDAIQFLRFAPVLKEIHPDVKVYVEVKKPLVALAKTMTGIDGVITYGDDIPDDATHCLPIMSLPIYCDVATEDDLPSCVPYFKVRKLPDIIGGNLKVGVCWRTGVRPYQPELASFADRKSVQTHFLHQLGTIPDITWVSLQLPKQDLPFPMIEPELYDFMDTAQLMTSLDLVISVDTSVAHLAGALGVRTVLMTPFDNCWRWRGNNLKSAWYPTLTQIRQPAPGDWPSVIDNVRKILLHGSSARAGSYEEDRQGVRGRS